MTHGTHGPRITHRRTSQPSRPTNITHTHNCLSRRQAGHIRRFASYIQQDGVRASGTCPLSTGGASFQNCYQDPPGVSSLTEVGSIRESCYPASRAEVQSPRQDGNPLCVNPPATWCTWFCPHRLPKLHEDCTRSIPRLRRERRFALQSSLMGPIVAVNREPAHSRILPLTHARLPCISLSLPVARLRPCAPSASSGHRGPTSLGTHPCVFVSGDLSWLAVISAWVACCRSRSLAVQTNSQSITHPFGAS